MSSVQFIEQKLRAWVATTTSTSTTGAHNVVMQWHFHPTPLTPLTLQQKLIHKILIYFDKLRTWKLPHPRHKQRVCFCGFTSEFLTQHTTPSSHFVYPDPEFMLNSEHHLEGVMQMQSKYTASSYPQKWKQRMRHWLRHYDIVVFNANTVPSYKLHGVFESVVKELGKYYFSYNPKQQQQHHTFEMWMKHQSKTTILQIRQRQQVRLYVESTLAAQKYVSAACRQLKLSLSENHHPTRNLFSIALKHTPKTHTGGTAVKRVLVRHRKDGERKKHNTLSPPAPPPPQAKLTMRRAQVQDNAMQRRIMMKKRLTMSLKTIVPPELYNNTVTTTTTATLTIPTQDDDSRYEGTFQVGGQGGHSALKTFLLQHCHRTAHASFTVNMGKLSREDQVSHVAMNIKNLLERIGHACHVRMGAPDMALPETTPFSILFQSIQVHSNQRGTRPFRLEM